MAGWATLVSCCTHEESAIALVLDVNNRLILRGKPSFCLRIHVVPVVLVTEVGNAQPPRPRQTASSEHMEIDRLSPMVIASRRSALAGGSALVVGLAMPNLWVVGQCRNHASDQIQAMALVMKNSN
ncbi:hypothetical protein LBMAG53_31320 [Planctomycetota bacterium]|nr:hypothetical protein LBMAG53_31320 [Planctomycetota bacterium]